MSAYFDDQINSCNTCVYTMVVFLSMLLPASGLWVLFLPYLRQYVGIEFLCTELLLPFSLFNRFSQLTPLFSLSPHRVSQKCYNGSW